MLSLVILCSPLQVRAEEGVKQNSCISPQAVQLQEQMRRLWIDHTTWTHNYIVSALAGLKDKDKVLARLLRNQADIGNAIKPYYGEDAGNKLHELLKDHILIAGKVVDAAKKGNQANLKKYDAEWHKNADDIAKFLSSANPNWTESEWKDLLYMHLKMVTDQVTARLKKDWDADIAASDLGEDHIIKIADTLTNGIIKQFPNQF
ncbi:glycosyltransferase [Paenibacillus sp. SI8]|uniref:glycosyltransferase n=1 Tax=unclassified Paenibacillus TaxID=185978 RepID=UPI003466DDBE